MIFDVHMSFFLRDFADNLITHVSQEDLKHLEKLKKV